MEGRPRKFLLTLAMSGAKRGPQWGRPKIRLRIFQSIKSYSFPKGLTHDFDPKIQIFLYFTTTKGQYWSFFKQTPWTNPLENIDFLTFLINPFSCLENLLFCPKLSRNNLYCHGKMANFRPKLCTDPNEKNSIFRRFQLLDFIA